MNSFRSAVLIQTLNLLHFEKRSNKNSKKWKIPILEKMNCQNQEMSKRMYKLTF